MLSPAIAPLDKASLVSIQGPIVHWSGQHGTLRARRNVTPWTCVCWWGQKVGKGDLKKANMKRPSLVGCRHK
jgi:hypothetical protein